MASKLPAILNATDEDITLLLSAQTHIGTKNCETAMEPYVWKRRPDGACSSQDIAGSPLLCHTAYVDPSSDPLRHPHYQRRQNLGEGRPRRPRNCFYPKPIGRCSDLRPSLRSTRCTQVCTTHRRSSDCRPLYSRFFHQLHYPLIQGAQADHRHRPPCRPPGDPRSRLCQHPRYRHLRYRRSSPVRRCCHPG